MNEEKRILLERKKAMQDAKNKLKHIDGQGLDVLDIFEEDTKPALEEIISEYRATHFSSDIPADYKISTDAPQEQIYSWIIEKLQLHEGKEYVLWERSPIWATIKINNVYEAVKSMWIHKHKNFILVDMESKKVLEVGNDSRDEYNYLIDIHVTKGRKYITKYCLDRINNLKYIFLYKLVDDDGRLCIEICSSTTYPTSKQTTEQILKENGNHAIAEILQNSMEIVPNCLPIYRITFESYVGYNVRNESYTCADESETFISESNESDLIYGNKFRLYTKSKYLEYLHENTFADQIEDYFHYEICCENQIIDVASCDMPIIEEV